MMLLYVAFFIQLNVLHKDIRTILVVFKKQLDKNCLRSRPKEDSDFVNFLIYKTWVFMLSHITCLQRFHKKSSIVCRQEVKHGPMTITCHKFWSTLKTWKQQGTPGSRCRSSAAMTWLTHHGVAAAIVSTSLDFTPFLEWWIVTRIVRKCSRGVSRAW